MNTQLVAGLLAAAVVIGGGAYFLARSSSPSTAENPAALNTDIEADTNTSAEAGEFEGSIVKLVARGGEWKCTVDSSSSTGAGQASASGVVYVSGEKIKADFDVTVPSLGAMKAYMIADGEYVYSWSSMMPQGVKMEQADSWSGEGAATSGRVVDVNSSYSYDCEPADADASLFVPPANVTFMTL